MTLRGKDYCNCDHAQMLRTAIEEALASKHYTHYILKKALIEDHGACLDLWGDLKEARSTR